MEPIIGEEIFTEKNICEAAVDFYSKLDQKENLDDNRIHRLIDKHIDTKLTDEQRDSIEGTISKNEILQTMKGIENDKSPGLNGLTREFYVINWDLIGNDLADVITNIYLQDRLPDSWTEGLITLIFKEKGDINNLKNWRPITY